jgi:peptidoglycan/LPS O-acetylase OafA/YrhL
MSNGNEIVNRMQTVPNHETNLDFVRAVAVLMVVGSHLAWFFGNVHLSFFQPALFGKLGVIIFFCHSGIVNMLSIERHVDKHGEHHLFRAFMTRRCFRIYPLSMFVVKIGTSSECINSEMYFFHREIQYTSHDSRPV